MDTQNQKQLVQEFLQRNKLCVLSTLNQDGYPNSAVMSFSETSELEIIFSTWNQTRKYANLQTNQKVSVTIGWSFDEFVTVQYQGIAEEINPEEVSKYRDIHIAKNEYSKKFAFLEDNKFFKIKPVWIKYSNLRTNPDEIFELKF